MKQLGTIDLETGELLNGVTVHMPHREKMSQNFVMMFKDPMLELATNRSLRGEQLRVLFYLLTKVGFNNEILITQKDAAAVLGLATSSVSTAMRKLVEQQILLVGPRIGNSTTYILSPIYGWCGDASEHRRQMARLLAPTPSRRVPAAGTQPTA